MCICDDIQVKLNINNYVPEETSRYLNPADINVPEGYRVEVYAVGLDAPSCMVFDEDRSLLIAESGFISGNARILRLLNNRYEFVADGFKPPITGMNVYKGGIYVSHKGYITVLRRDGTRENIIMGLPSNGDYGNCNVDFDVNGKMYFGQGTVTNSGIVGLDNTWVIDYPFGHDYPGSYILLNGQNFPTPDILAVRNPIAYTGAFAPFGEMNMPYEIRKAAVKASGSILRANPDGSELELVVWGLRFPSHIRFDHSGRLFAANQGFENRGSRPVDNAPDEFQLITQGIWYGWPDFAGGEPVTASRFTPEGGRPLEFLLANHPNVPPRPFAIFPSHSTIVGFDFNYSNFGPYGHAYITEFGSAGRITDGLVTPYAGFGHRISEIDMGSGGITTFAINKSGFSASITREGGFSRPVDLVFGTDRAMYVLDFGLNDMNNPNLYFPNTGVIWRIYKI